MAENSELVDNEIIQKIMAEKQSQFAYRNLAVFSVLLFVIPFPVMYIFNSVFKERYNLTDSDAIIYSGVFAIFAVYSIIGAFAYSAYREDSQMELNRQKKED